MLIVAFHHTGSTLLRRLLGGSSRILEHHRDAATPKVGLVPCEWLHPCSTAARAQNCNTTAGTSLLGEHSNPKTQADVPVVLTKKTINDDEFLRLLQWSADNLGLDDYPLGSGGCGKHMEQQALRTPRIRWRLAATIVLVRDPMDTTFSLMKRMLGVDAAQAPQGKHGRLISSREFHFGAWESLGRAAALVTAAPWTGARQVPSIAGPPPAWSTEEAAVLACVPPLSTSSSSSSGSRTSSSSTSSTRGGAADGVQLAGELEQDKQEQAQRQGKEQ